MSAGKKITTDRQVSALKASDRVYETSIGEVRGLAVRTFPTGTRAFEFRYVSEAGVRRRMPLGEYPGLSLAEACRKAAALRVRVVDGEDPAGQRLADRTRARTGDTLDELADAYWLAAAKGLHGGRGRPKAASTLSVERPRYKTHISSKLGTRRFADLKRSDIKGFMRELAASELAADTVASIGRTLSVILNFAVHEERIEANPAQGLTQPRALKPRDRMFPETSLRALWTPLSVAPAVDGRSGLGCDVQKVSPAISLALKLELLTLTRRADVAGAQWDEIDWKSRTWTVPANRHKSRRVHVVPLGPEALTTFRRAARLSSSDSAGPDERPQGYVFPSPVKANHHITERAMTRALARMCADVGVPLGSPHDFRRTGATQMTSEQLGVRRFIVSKVLGHAAHEGAVVTAVYDRNEYLGDKRKALEAWEASLLEIVGERLKGAEIL